MAQMWPRQLPQEIKKDKRRSAERKVYQRLEEILDDSFDVFYSCSWLEVGRDGREFYGEADFVVAHPQLGILVLEVKGGRVVFDPETGNWTSQDRKNKIHPIKDPVKQAESSIHTLLDKLKENTGWHKGHIIRIRHGVVLPDASLPEGDQDLGANKPRHIFWAHEDFYNDRNWIHNRMGEAPKEGNKEKPLGPDGIQALQEILALRLEFDASLQNLFSEDEDELKELTKTEYSTLKKIRRVQRAAISGAAGTGKTMLALQEAAEQAKGEGKRVLFLCFNRALSEWVQRGVAKDAGFEVKTFHSLCWHMDKISGLEGASDGTSRPQQGDTSEATSDGWSYDKAPEKLLTAFKHRPDMRYDAIIVDEGQDFEKDWWVALNAGLKEDGILRVFHDNNQRIYPGTGELPDDVEAIDLFLDQNLRNTEHIHKAVNRFYVGNTVMPSGIKGVEVKWLRLPTGNFEAIGQALSEYAVNLIEQEKIPPEDIAVLCSNQTFIKAIAPDGRFGEHKTTESKDPQDGAIVVDTIRKFKGLESPVVLLAADKIVKETREMPYVAMSRARVHLVVAGKKTILDWLCKPTFDT